MHIISYTNAYGVKRHVELPASQITHVLELCKSLQSKKINYHHVFVD